MLGRRDWDADALRDIDRDYVIEQLADDDAVLVIDETGFLKQARRRAEWRGNTLVPPARSRTARSGFSLPTFRATVMRSSTPSPPFPHWYGTATVPLPHPVRERTRDLPPYCTARGRYAHLVPLPKR